MVSKVLFWRMISSEKSATFRDHALAERRMTAIDKPLRDAAGLVKAGLLAPERQGEVERVGERYAIAVSPAMAALVDPGDPDDPIARQFVPDPPELRTSPEERADPIGDTAHSPVEGIVHRYP